MTYMPGRVPRPVKSDGNFFLRLTVWLAELRLFDCWLPEERVAHFVENTDNFGGL